MLKYFVPVLGLILLGGGCLPSPKSLVENVIEKKINTELGAEGSVNIDGDAVTFTDKEGNTGSYGANVTIPSDFPSDIPILEGALVSGVAVNAEGAWIAFATNQSADEVIAWYEAELLAAGWVKEGSYSVEATTTMAFAKDDSVLGVMAATAESGTIVTVSKSKQ